MGSRDGAHTLGRWIADRARLAPDRVAVVDRGVPLNYDRMHARVEALATNLAEAGHRQGDRIATLTGNSSDHVVLFFACARAGLVLVPLSWRLTFRELAEQIAHSDPSLMVVEDEFATLGREALASVAARVPTIPFGQAEARGSLPKRSWPTSAGSDSLLALSHPVGDDAPLLMVFTSGTGGAPKAAVLSHATCWWTNLSLSRTIELSDSDVILAVLPQFHVGGWNIQPLLAWWMGATVVLERTFDPGRALALIDRHQVTSMMAVPTQYLMMAEHHDFAGSALSSLRNAVVGGAPMPAPLMRTFHAHGVALTQGYGLTEAGPNVLCVPPDKAHQHVGAAGVPYPHVEVALADPSTGEHLEGVATGELLVRGPGMFSGYFRDDEASAAIWRNGWLATGDVASRDDEGYLRIVDRLRNIYISGGENVSPAEVEGVLLEHPGVADAVVVGMLDERWGERGVALLVRRQGIAVDDIELERHCRERLAAYKVPAEIHWVSHLPQAGLGKIARAASARVALDLTERSSR
ncbi:AMP-binding protein [Ornithinimicrobium sp. Arc0846-15]|nr:AMP-binding protein [Ornithinimicrobium laminariae]